VPDLVQILAGARSAREVIDRTETGIRQGAVAPDSQLPSIRQLAGALGLSPTTLVAAIAELRRRGLVVTEPRKGSRVAMRPAVVRSAARLALAEGVVDLRHGAPDPTLLPRLDEALAAVAREDRPPRLYGEPSVDERLEAIGRGLVGGNVSLASGALDGVERALASHLRASQRVAVEDPGYHEVFDLLRVLGLVPEPVPIDDEGMLPDGLAAAIARGAQAVVITPRGQNPTGAALTPRRAAELSALLAASPNVLTIEDDHLGDIGGPGATVTSGLERYARVRSLAKTLGPDLRLAIVGGDRVTMARFEARHQRGPGWVSHILQRLALNLLSDPATSGLVAQAEQTYRNRRDALISSLAAHGISASGASGLNVWIPVPDETAVTISLLQEGYAVAPGAPYRLHSPPAIRITTSTLSVNDASELAEAVKASFAPTRGRRA
jgi:DNA-binding transcriptional MocR family regulator